MKKIIFFLLIGLIHTDSSAQLILVPNQPENGTLLNDKTIHIDEDLSFLSYILVEDPIGYSTHYYSFKNHTIEKIEFDLGEDWGDIRYMGELNNRYFFISNATGGVVALTFHEYNRDTDETAILTLPGDYTRITPLATINGKFYFQGRLRTPPYQYQIISYDGNTFEAIDQLAPEPYESWRNFYSPSQNLMYILYVNHAQNTSKLYTYDGVTSNELQFPANMNFGVFFDEFNAKVMMSFSDGSTSPPYNIQLYESDGVNLTHISPGADKVLEATTVESKENRRYYHFMDAATGITENYFYEYDGADLTLIPSLPKHTYFQFLSEFDGKDYFSIFHNDISKAKLHSYDGSNLTLIEGEEGAGGLMFGGILNNKLYIVYPKRNDINVLTSLSPGASEVIPVANIPENSIVANTISYQNMIIYNTMPLPIAPEDGAFYAMTINNEFFELKVPEPSDYNYASFEFMKNDLLYFQFTHIEDRADRLFVWDGILGVPNVEYSMADILVFPNPAKEVLSVQLSASSYSGDIALNIYSLDGKRVGSYSHQNSSQIELPVSHLEEGIYILEIRNNSGNTFKKFIKN